jgi:hypothetical protein
VDLLTVWSCVVVLFLFFVLDFSVAISLWP